MPRWFKITFWALFGVVVILFAVFQYTVWSISDSDWNFSSSSDSHWEARADFLQSLSGHECLTRDVIHAAAKAQDYESWDVDGDFGWCHRPTGLRDWMGVEVRPVQFMSTRDENSEYFGFDQNGCATPIEYASGPDSTCPD